jgi:transposase-like protein
MTKPIARDPIYRRWVFDAEIIELCVRWYITYRLSYRDLVGMMAERGVMVAQSTILRWVTRYVPEYEKRWNRLSRPVGTSWRTDETCISIRGKWHYLYRAVDKQGKTVDFLLRRDRGIAAAQTFFRKAARYESQSMAAQGDAGRPCAESSIPSIASTGRSEVANLSRAERVIKAGVVYDPKALIDSIR